MPRPSVPSRRGDILKAARQVFIARGFAAARMDDIARATGISKAALYLQFSSKEALFEAATIEMIERMLPAVLPGELGDVPAPPVLRAMIAGLASQLANPDMAFVPRVIIGEGMNFPELARFYHEHAIKRGAGAFESVIRHGVARGEFATADPGHAARSVIGGLLVTAIWKQVFEPVGADPVDPAAAALVHAETILSGLCVRKDG